MYEQHYKEYKTSKMTREEYCKSRNLKLETFEKWIEEIENPDPYDKTFDFIQLPVKASKESYFDVIINDTIKIRVYKYFDAELLERLIKSMKVSNVN